MKVFVGRLISILIVAGGWLLYGGRTVLDLVGYSTFPDDTKVALGRLDAAFMWLLSVPWWAALGFALISTIALMYFSWPRRLAETITVAAESASRPRPPARTVRAATTNSPPMVKPLTAHAVEQKLKVIDHAIDLMRDAGTFRDRLRELFRDPWQTGSAPVSPDNLYDFSDKIGVLHEDVIRFFQRIEELQRDDDAIYPDIVQALDRTDYQHDATERLAEYRNACREIEIITAKGGSIGDVSSMYGQFVGRTEKAVERIMVWREAARNHLVKIRSAISAA